MSLTGHTCDHGPLLGQLVSAPRVSMLTDVEKETSRLILHMNQVYVSEGLKNLTAPVSVTHSHTHSVHEQ